MSSAGPSDERLRALLLDYLGRRRAGEEVDPAAFAAAHADEAARLLPLLTAVAGLPLDRAEAYVGEMLGAFEGGDAPAPDGSRTMQLPGVQEAVELYDRRYRVISILGEGGFGCVYKVEDTLNPGGQLALKEVLAEHQNTERFERRFRTEIQVQRNLSHPGIPQIFNDGKTEGGSFYYTMAFVEGTTLEDVLLQDAPLDPARVVRLVRQILDVLEYAHGKGVVHRDLKPLNVVITDAGTEEERAHVLDFGIAKILDKESQIEHTLTMESAGPMGSPDYMSPEQVRGQEVDGSSDLYALGVIIYRMVTGELPFSGKTLMEVLTARLDREPPALDGKTVPPWLAQLVKGLLAREKEARPSTAQIQSQLSELAEGQKHLQRRQNVALMVAAGAAVLVGLWFGVSALLGGGDGGGAGGGGGRGARSNGGRGVVVAAGIAITAPVTGTHLNASSVKIAGTSEGAQAVTLRATSDAGEEQVGSAAVEDGSFEQELALEEGSWRITVHEDPQSEEVLAEIQVVIDRTPPTIALVGDPPGLALDGPDAPRLVTERRVPLEFQVEDAEPGAVLQVVRDNAVPLIDERGRLRLDLNLDAAGDPERVDLVVSDRAGNSASYKGSWVYAGPPPSVSWGSVAAPGADGTVQLVASIAARPLAPEVARLIVVTADEARDDEALWNAGEPVAVGLKGEVEVERVASVGVTRFALVARDALGRLASAVTTVKRPPRLLELEVAGSQVDAAGRVELPPGTEPVRLSGRADAPLERVELGSLAATTSQAGFELDLEVGAEELERELRFWHAGSELEGEPVRITFARRKPTVPAGCTAMADTEVDEAGRATRVKHGQTGAELLLVPESKGALRTQPAFYLGRFELTRGQFGVEGERDLPAAKVSVEDAGEFCDRNGLRLPTVDEWLWALRGEAQSTFPWGDAWQDGKANIKGQQDGSPSAAAVDEFMQDLSWCGAVGLCGNVSEWCTGTAEAPITYRGGNFRSPAPTDANGSSLQLDEQGPRAGMLKNDTQLDTIGFRVALDAQP